MLSPELFAAASASRRNELLTIPGNLLSPFIAFEILAYQGTIPDSETAQKLKKITPDPLIAVIQAYLSFQAQVVPSPTPFVRLFPSSLIAFTDNLEIVVAKMNHYQILPPNASPKQILETSIKILSAEPQPVSINPGDSIQVAIQQMLAQPRPKPER